MNILNDFEIWVTDHRDRLAGEDEFHFSRSPVDRDNVSAHLNINSGTNSIELLVWESGDAEFNSSIDGNAAFEHVDITNMGDLEALLGRFAERLRQIRN